MSERPERGASFVVWLDPGDAAACAGRVENVATSRRRRFETAEQLIAFMFESRREARGRQEPPPGSVGPPAE